MTVTEHDFEGAAGAEDEPRGAARALRQEFFPDEALRSLIAKAGTQGVSLTGPDGFLSGLVKDALEAGMKVELTDHLGYERHDRAGRGSGNSRNGTSPKTIATAIGEVQLDQPRDRAGTFSSSLVPKGARRIGGLDEIIISLYAGGMTIREIEHHLATTIGTELSHETISNIPPQAGGAPTGRR